MFGLDQWVAGFSDGTTLLVICVVAIVLGLRHATDPDHLAAVTTLVASGRGRGAARIGASWGAGHATSLIAFGTPIVLARAYLPESVQRDVETAVGGMIVVLAVSLLVRIRRGRFHVQVHEHGDEVHAHGARTPWQAYAIGLVHGIGGSAGVGVLLLASIGSRAIALVALVLFASCTALSMSLLTAGVGATMTRPRFRAGFARLAPVFGAVSLAFGVWYGLGAQGLLPYAF
jgi:high-affinity nickel permease